MKNKYAKRACISERKIQQLVRLFSAGLEASQVAKLTGLDGMSKGDMIRATQIAEGSRGCYDNIWRHEYLEYECCWREDCHTPIQE